MGRHGLRLPETPGKPESNITLVGSGFHLSEPLCMLSIPLVHIPSTPRLIVTTYERLTDHIVSVLSITDKTIR
jgi:hypothetical protein